MRIQIQLVKVVTLLAVTVFSFSTCSRSNEEPLPENFPKDARCKSLNGCLGLLYADARSPSPMRDKRSSIRAVVSFGAPALPAIIKYTQDEYRPVREIACTVLGQIAQTEKLSDKELPVLHSCMEFEPKHALLSIAAIGSPKARGYLKEHIEDLKKIYDSDDIFTSSVSDLKCAPGTTMIFELLVDEMWIAKDKFSTILFNECQNTAKSLLPQVWSVASTSQTTVLQKSIAVGAMTNIGSASLQYKTKLRQLFRETPALKKEIDLTWSFIQMGDTASVREALTQARC